MNTFAGLYPGEILFKVVNPQGAMIFDRDGSTPLGTGSIPPGTTIGGTPRGDGYIVEVSQKPYVGWVHALDLNQLTSPPPSPVLASGDYAGDDVEHLMPATGCPKGTYWNDMYGKCMPAGIPSPPPAVGFWPYFPPPNVEEMGCDDCDTVVSGDPCGGVEEETVASAFLNPIGAALSAQQLKRCRERRMHWGRGREHDRGREHEHHHHHHHHRAGWEGEWGWEHPHHHHHRPWWEQFYVGQAPSGDPVKAPAHPAVQAATTQATQAPVVHQATQQAAQSPAASASHVSDVSQAATHAQAATTAATTATQTAPVAAHPEPAKKAAASARSAATQARSATAAAAHPTAPGTRAAKAARTSAAHASRATSHAHAATESRGRGEAEAHERAAHAHGRAAAAHARIAHGEARRGVAGRRTFANREWWRRPEFADYERQYGSRWWERPEFHEFGWRYGGEWWRRPEFADYERTYGERWWERPEFATYAQRYAQEDQGDTTVLVPTGNGAGAQVVCILPGDDGVCLKEMVTGQDGTVFFRLTDAGQAAGISLDEEELAHNASLGGDQAGDDTVTSGDFAGWGHGGGDLFTDPYGRFDPRLPAAWDTQYMYFPDYYYGAGPRVGIQSGPAIVGAMAHQPRGMHGGFYHSSPEIEQRAAMEQIEAMYPDFGDGGDGGDAGDAGGPGGLPGTYPGYGFGGWGFWGHGL